MMSNLDEYTRGCAKHWDAWQYDFEHWADEYDDPDIEGLAEDAIRSMSEKDMWDLLHVAPRVDVREAYETIEFDTGPLDFNLLVAAWAKQLIVNMVTHFVEKKADE